MSQKPKPYIFQAYIGQMTAYFLSLFSSVPRHHAAGTIPIRDPHLFLFHSSMT